MTKRFEGKVALVTGGAQGIGEACVMRLASEGAKVAFVDLQEDKGAVVVEKVKGVGSEALFGKVDITNDAQVQDFVKKAIEKFGKIDIVVNVVGLDFSGPFVKYDEATIDKIIAINLKGHMLVTKAAMPGMMERSYGKIVSISSDAGLVGQKNSSIYSACKAGIIGWSKTVARETVKYKINVNVVCPGPTRTPLLEASAKENPKLIEALNKSVPWGRVAEPEEIAAAVAFLASDDAGYITGQTLSVNGGLNMI